MNTYQIERALKENKFFIGVYPLNHLPCVRNDRDQGFIVNTDPCTQDGQHWVAVSVLSDGTGEYFDSFARPVPKEIRKFLANHVVKYEKSDKMIQHPFSTSCGQFCIQYINLRSRGQDILSFQAGFTPNDLHGNEIKIQKLTRQMNKRRRRRPGKL